MATKRKSSTGGNPASRKRAAATSAETQPQEPRRSDEQRRESATRRVPSDGPAGMGKTVRGGYAEQQPQGATSGKGTPAGKKRRP